MVSESHIALRRKQVTGQAVLNKLAVLQDWIEHGLPWQRDENGALVRDAYGEQVLFDYPKDLKAFGEWKGRPQWSGPNPSHQDELQVISRSTLNQDSYDKTRDSIRKMLDLVGAKAKLQLEQTNKVSVIASLQAELDFANKIASRQEEDVIRLRREADASRKQLGDELALRLRNEEELQREKALLEARIAQLVKLLSKVTPISRAKK